MKNIIFLGFMSVFLFHACSGEEKNGTESKVVTTTSEIKKKDGSKIDSIQAKSATATKSNLVENEKVQIDATSFLKEGGTSIEVIGKDGKAVKIDMVQPKVIAKGAKVKEAVTTTAKETITTVKKVKPVSKEAPSKNALPIDINEMITQPSVKSSAPKAEINNETSSVQVSPETIKEVVETKEVIEFNHTTWNELLQKYVTRSGKVNYKGFQSDDRFESYLKGLQNNPVQSDWSKAKKMAYWINAYNAFTIKLITDNYPVSSITNLDGGKPWDKKWIKLGDKMYSLNNIENDILRPTYKDARIHFAVNCAATSCPTLLNKAWTADNLERNFEQQAKAFINNVGFNTITEKEISISKIFEWYAGDFGDIIDYLNQYSDTKISPKAKVTYQEYDWSLNKQ